MVFINGHDNSRILVFSALNASSASSKAVPAKDEKFKLRFKKGRNDENVNRTLTIAIPMIKGIDTTNNQHQR